MIYQTGEGFFKHDSFTIFDGVQYFVTDISAFIDNVKMMLRSKEVDRLKSLGEYINGVEINITVVVPEFTYTEVILDAAQSFRLQEIQSMSFLRLDEAINYVTSGIIPYNNAIYMVERLKHMVYGPAVILLRNPMELSLEELREYKKQEINKMCGHIIENEFYSDCLSGDPEAKDKFDCAAYDISYIQGLNLIAQEIIDGDITKKVRWKESAVDRCYEWEALQMTKLGSDLQHHLETNIDRMHELKVYIKTAQKEELLNFNWYTII